MLIYRHAILSQKLVVAAVLSKRFVILACSILIQLQSVTNTHTSGYTDASTIAITRYNITCTVIRVQ